jgi:hypothetical protein
MSILPPFLLTLVVLAAAQISLARIVDPRGDFGTGRFPVLTLASRSTKPHLFEQYNAVAPITGVVLGSSRAMKLMPSELDGLLADRFFNFGVDNARTEDYLAIYRWIRQQHVPIRTVLIGLDVEALHDNNTIDDRLRTNPALWQALQPALSPPSIRQLPSEARTTFRTYTKLFTPAYITDVAHAVHLLANPRQLDERSAYFEPDGYLRYAEWERDRAAGRFSLEAETAHCLHDFPDRFRDMRDLSSARRSYLENTIRDAVQDGARVLVYISSIQSATAEYTEGRTAYGSLLRKTQDYLDGLRAQFAIHTLDLSSPDSVGMSPQGWYDCQHIDETNATIIAHLIANEFN